MFLTMKDKKIEKIEPMVHYCDWLIKTKKPIKHIIYGLHDRMRDTIDKLNEVIEVVNSLVKNSS